MDNKASKQKDIEVLTNVYFLLNEAIDMLYNRVEYLLNSDNRIVRQEFKQNHNRLMDGLKKMKYALNRTSDLCNILNIENWDRLHEDANYIMRIIMLVIDRCGDNDQIQDSIEKYLRKRKSCGILTEKTIDSFRLR